MDSHYFMQHALALAKAAEKAGEVPVGAVLVYEGRIIGEGHNQPITTYDPSAHAEIVAMRQGALQLGNYRLINCDLYVTLEPCFMCASAMVHARLRRVVYAAQDPKAGAVVSVATFFEHPALNHRVLHEGGVLEAESRALLQGFFQQRRGK